MFRKYFPFIVLFAAIALLYWVKTHQGVSIKKPITVEEPFPAFVRENSILVYSKHALCRMDCRHIDESEVKEILANGTLNYDKVEKSTKGYSYPLEGYTHDAQHVRIVFAPHHDTMVVITAIDLEKEWTCDCK